MNWKQVLFRSCLMAFVVLMFLKKVEPWLWSPRKQQQLENSARKVLKESLHEGIRCLQLFQEKRQRSTKSRDELNAETRQMLAADEQRREYYEEQRNEFENFVEEERDEQMREAESRLSNGASTIMTVSTHRTYITGTSSRAERESGEHKTMEMGNPC
ncbi:unique cartilage matrix-associated protein [Lacerta agilis]|uniref:unique cartilage matrix-associated protein n=1 Tax=Lacerta agilis TaxID=80427 RepID=UPI001419A029|nr:unique cartilage matrix-associated protein [Lacerta agilis]